MAVIAEVALRRNPEARFEEVYASCQPRVFRTCLAILRNADDAAEATQEVFSRALPLVTDLREPHVWLQTVARNYCLDQLRRQKVRGLGTTLAEDTPSSPRDDPEREALLRDALRQAFEALNGRERRALARVLLMDDSLADIAAMLGVSYSAAAQVVSRARRRAALAARAVIGASLGWLAGLGAGRGRERVTRAAAQAFESGQHVLLAAAVLFTAGTMAHSVGATARGDAHAMAPHLLAAASGSTTVVAPAAASVPPGVVPVGVPVPALPAGYVAGGKALVIDDPSRQSPPGTVGPTPNPGPITVQPTLVETSKCVGVNLTAGPSGDPTVNNQTVEACEP